MEEISIVVVGYNRKDSLSRLLKSLNKVNYLNEKVRLYISIDKDEKNIEKHNSVVEVANNFEWKYGEKIVNCEPKNLGLKQHILKCGNLTNKYENIIVLEDDLIVSPLMYIYAKQALEYYKNNDKIAGFGLYSFQRNPINNLPFYPLNNGTDVYFMQYACSWGQMWTKNKWNEFYNWYNENKDKEFANSKIPNNVCQWGNKSWLKFHIKYVIETNKYFVYPQIGLTSNFTESGTHNKRSSFAYQCIMGYSDKNVLYRFSNLDEAINVYDGFFENVRLGKCLNYEKKVICDFYGEKDIKSLEENKYLLTTKEYNYKIISQFSLQMYPYELNVINNIAGKDIKLYNIEENCVNNKTNYNILRYIFRLDFLSTKQIKVLIKSFVSELLQKVLAKIKKGK